MCDIDSIRTAATFVDGDSVPEESPKRNKRNKGCLTQSALNTVVHSTSDLYQQVAKTLKRKFSETMEKCETMSGEVKISLIEKMNAWNMMSLLKGKQLNTSRRRTTKSISTIWSVYLHL